MDTETTSLHPDREAWDIAIIRREPDGTETTTALIVDDCNFSEADPMSLKIGGFFDRHPRFGGVLPPGYQCVSEVEAADQVEAALRRAHLVGTVPNFDEHVLKELLADHFLPWSAHYHLIDTEALCVGWLAARGRPPEPPWRSDDLSREVGVDPPGPEQRHTALGDALWARDIYDRILHGEMPEQAHG